MIITVLPGIILVGIVGYDVFITLFNPEQQGSLSHRGLNRLWKLLKRVLSRKGFVSPRLGPIFFVLVLLSWLVGMILGWALIYWPFLDEDSFLFSRGLDPSAQQSFVDALYYSAVTMTTLGYGDLTPRDETLRAIAPVEALIGFALLTAGLTWLLSLYPSLANARSFAQRVHVLDEQREGRGLLSSGFSETSAASAYENLTQQLIITRTELQQFPIVFYFRTRDKHADISWALDQLPRLIEAEERANPPASVQVHIDGLKLAIDRFLADIARSFLDMGGRSTEDILAEYNRRRNPASNGE